jgi:solute carrier family 25 (mitochondrial aspartate/glutamate transporter), member 12/13
MAAVKGALQGTPAGARQSEADPNPSAQTRANFEKYARRDESGESYMTEEDFVNAIVPKDEDFVGSKSFRCVAVHSTVDRQLRL